MDPARFRFLLAPKDQVEYPRGDEWFTFDIDALDAEMPTSDVIKLESDLGVSLDQVLHGLAFGATRAKLWAFYIARRRAGVKEDLEFFTPQVRAASVFHLDDKEPVKADDAAPPESADSAGEPPKS
jgi:hypothetical protein